MDEPVFYSADGTSRRCALPNYDYLYDDKYPLQRHYRVKYLYSEYEQACEAAGERPYAFSTFINKKVKWRRGRVTESRPPWHPGERVCCYWTDLPENVARDEQGSRRCLFVAALPYSDYSFACPSESRSLVSWMECCAKAYRSLGGVPHVTECRFTVYRSATGAGSTALLTLQAFSVHYRTVLFHAGPKTKKTASRRVKPLMVKNSSKAMRYLRSRLADCPPLTFAELEAKVSEIMDEFNSAPVKGKAAPRDLFEEQEKPQLLSLPADDYDMAIWASRSVGSDYHINHRGVRYSVPCRYVHETVRLRASEHEVRIYCGGDLIAAHAVPEKATRNRVITDPSHRPPAHKLFTRRFEERFMALARKVGPATGAIMREVLSACEKSGGSYRPCKDLLDLQNTPSGITLEEACMKVLDRQLDMTVPSVASVMREGTR